MSNRACPSRDGERRRPVFPPVLAAYSLRKRGDTGSHPLPAPHAGPFFLAAFGRPLLPFWALGKGGPRSGRLLFSSEIHKGFLP